MTDFQIGDVVVCVFASALPEYGEIGVVEGRLYRIVGFCDPGYPQTTACGLMSDLGLYLDGVLGNSISRAFASFRFRKLKAADEQFTEQMRELRPAKVPATLSRSSENRNGTSHG